MIRWLARKLAAAIDDEQYQRGYAQGWRDCQDEWECGRNETLEAIEREAAARGYREGRADADDLDFLR